MEHGPKQDRNFDDLADRLKENVYGSPKGRLRIDTVWEDLATHVPGLANGASMTVLDAGGGLGQISLRMAKRGHRIVLCDISGAMIQKAEKRFCKEGLEDRLTLVHGPLQELYRTYGGTVDIILAHGVLEWLARPRTSLSDLRQCLKPGGFLSLLFYNVNALIFQNAIKGNFRKVMSENFAGHEGSLTPQNPLDPDTVLSWLAETGLELKQVTGVRVFFDYMARSIRNERTYEDVLELERAYCRKAPFAFMAKYIHLIGHAKGGCLP